MSSPSAGYIILCMFHQMRTSLKFNSTVVTQVERSFRTQQNDDSSKMLPSTNFWTASCYIKLEVNWNGIWGMHRTGSFQGHTPVHNGLKQAALAGGAGKQNTKTTRGPQTHTWTLFTQPAQDWHSYSFLYCRSNNLGTADIHPATGGREAVFSEMVPWGKDKSSSPRSGKRKQPKSKKYIGRVGLILQENTFTVFQLKNKVKSNGKCLLQQWLQQKKARNVLEIKYKDILNTKNC